MRRRSFFAFHRHLLVALMVVCVFLCATPIEAKAGTSFIRDAEIERYLHDLAAPIYKAADLSPDSVSIYIINDNQLNAFVAEGMNEFFNTGLLIQAETPEQLMGVIAHETGHIAGGHLIRGQEAMKNASSEALLGMLLGVAAGLATGNSQVTVAAIGGAQTVAEREMLGYSRAQESSADSAAMRYLDRAGYSSEGLLSFMKKLEGQEYLPTDRKSEYVRTHPMSIDRITTIEEHIRNSQKTFPPTPTQLVERHERMRAKLQGFLQPETVLLRTTDKDMRVFQRYGRAIALYRTNQTQRAIALLDSLVAESPKDPYFLELKAQMLFETGHIDQSADLYATVVKLAPQEPLLHTAYGHALLEKKSNDMIDQAIEEFQTTLALAPKESQVWRFLATAWGRKAEKTKDIFFEGLASYALAEEALAEGNDEEAQRLADRALKVVPRNSPYWIKAQDIKLSSKNGANKRKD